MSLIAKKQRKCIILRTFDILYNFNTPGEKKDIIHVQKKKMLKREKIQLFQKLRIKAKYLLKSKT